MRDLCNPDGSCSHRCGQGDCEGSRRASCMALGLHRLVQVDGGESVDYEGIGINGLTEAETRATASVMGIVKPRARPLRRPIRAARAVDYLMAGLAVFFVLGLVFSCFK